MKPATGTARRARLATTRICLVVTEAICRLPWEEAVALALGCASVGMVQLREKKLSDTAFVKRAKRLRAMCDAVGALLILNDRAHLVVKTGADGVHLGEDDMSPLDARALLGPTVLIGVSTHDAQELEAAPRAGADYAGLGPCFPTTTKTLTRAPGGAALLKEALPVARLPVFAIGGIDSDNVRLLVEAGADRIAVGAGLLGRDDPATAARVLAAALDAHPRRVPRRKKKAKHGRGRHRTS